jgi:hypothetical protein
MIISVAKRSASSSLLLLSLDVLKARIHSSVRLVFSLMNAVKTAFYDF